MTGVQTCALPILADGANIFLGYDDRPCRLDQTAVCIALALGFIAKREAVPNWSDHCFHPCRDHFSRCFWFSGAPGLSKSAFSYGQAW